MQNLYNDIVLFPQFFRQFNCGESLITMYNCPLEKKKVDIWSRHSYIAYVVEGRKIWHTPHGSFELKKGSCVFVRKGAAIVEQFFDTAFCIIFFFVPDDFICDVLKEKKVPVFDKGQPFEAVIDIDRNSKVDAFFNSMIPHFEERREPDPALLELKFRELILTLADNPRNTELNAYFSFLMQAPQTVSLQRVMEDNYCFNLKLEEYARLSRRSLSAFKRDFFKIYQTTPGKWLQEKRLNHARLLLSGGGKSIGDAAFESGFESTSHFSRSFKEQFGISPSEVSRKKVLA